MTGVTQYNQKEPDHKWRVRDGFTPNYPAVHEVYITKDFGVERNEDLIAFIGKHITEYKGKTEDKHGIPLMLFDRRQDAQKFANELSARLNVTKEHIAVKDSFSSLPFKSNMFLNLFTLAEDFNALLS